MASKSLPSESVEIMGQEFSDSKNHHQHDLFWGIFLIFSGTIFLFNSLGLVPWSIWSQLWRVWPIFVILTGLRLVLDNSPLSRFILSVISIALFILLAVYVLYLTIPEFLPPLPYEMQNMMQNWQTGDINEI